MKASELISVIIGIGFILYGCFGKNFEYATGIIYSSTPAKKAPTWLGRAMFIVVGVLILLPVGLRYFDSIGQ